MKYAHDDSTAGRQLIPGALVQTYYDTGRGLQVLYGEVIAAGAKVVSIRWESGIVNRLRRDHALDRDVRPAEDLAEAREAVAASHG